MSLVSSFLVWQMANFCYFSRLNEQSLCSLRGFVSSLKLIMNLAQIVDVRIRYCCQRLMVYDYQYCHGLRLYSVYLSKRSKIVMFLKIKFPIKHLWLY